MKVPEKVRVYRRDQMTHVPKENAKTAFWHSRSTKWVKGNYG